MNGKEAPLNVFVKGPLLRNRRCFYNHFFTCVLAAHAGHSLTVGIVGLFTESMPIIIVVGTTALNETKHTKEKR